MTSQNLWSRAESDADDRAGVVLVIFAHVDGHFGRGIMLSRLEWLVSVLRLLRRRVVGFIAGRLLMAVAAAAAVAGTERLLRCVFRRAVAVVVEVDGAEVAVRLGVVPAAAVLRARSAADAVRVAVRAQRDGRLVVEVVAVVAAYRS